MLRKGEDGLTFSSWEVSEGHFLGVWGVLLGRQQGQPVTLQQHSLVWVSSSLPFFLWLCCVFIAVSGLLWLCEQAQLPCGLWALSSPPGVEPVSRVLEGGFLTTGPPGRSHPFLFWLSVMVRQSVVVNPSSLHGAWSASPRVLAYCGWGDAEHLLGSVGWAQSWGREMQTYWHHPLHATALSLDKLAVLFGLCLCPGHSLLPGVCGYAWEAV